MKKRNLLNLFHVHQVGNLKRLVALPLVMAAIITPGYASSTNKNALEIKAFKADIQISGTVKDASGETLPGVSVSIKGGGKTVVTDAMGKYSITVPENATLVFNYIGFSAKEVVVGSNPVINVTLESSNTALDDVVVIGYQTIRRKDLTGATGSVNTGILKN